MGTGCALGCHGVLISRKVPTPALHLPLAARNFRAVCKFVRKVTISENHRSGSVPVSTVSVNAVQPWSSDHLGNLITLPPTTGAATVLVLLNEVLIVFDSKFLFQA